MLNVTVATFQMSGPQIPRLLEPNGTGGGRVAANNHPDTAQVQTHHPEHQKVSQTVLQQRPPHRKKVLGVRGRDSTRGPQLLPKPANNVPRSGPRRHKIPPQGGDQRVRCGLQGQPNPVRGSQQISQRRREDAGVEGELHRSHRPHGVGHEQEENLRRLHQYNDQRLVGARATTVQEEGGEGAGSAREVLQEDESAGNQGGEDVPGESCRSPRRQLQKHLVDSGFHCRRS
jgi:hypothetical protein